MVDEGRYYLISNHTSYLTQPNNQPLIPLPSYKSFLGSTGNLPGIELTSKKCKFLKTLKTRRGDRRPIAWIGRLEI